ncbi:MAG: hypothetical protein PVI80_16525 [Anaerolineae bacterium]
MKPAQLSLWDQTQLVLLRSLGITLGLLDRTFNLHWGEQVLTRMSERWQAQLEQLDQEIAALEKERHQSQLLAEALVIHAATIYLAGRLLAHEELRFDPAIPPDEEILDATIDMLVKQQLATIAAEEIEPGHFVYDLEPDWAAIYDRLDQAAHASDPEFAEWFQESLKLIKEALLPQPGIQPQPSHPSQYEE